MIVLGTYRPGASPLHRLPALAKILGLIAWGIATMIFTDPVTSLGIAAAAVLLLISVLPPLWPTVKGMAFIVIVAALAAAYQVYRGDYTMGIDIAADLVGLFSLSIAVTTSTPMGELLDLAAAAFRPFRKVIPPAIPGLMFAIMIRAIPEVATIMRQSRDAAKARGVQRSAQALMIPTATRTVGFALDLGAALHARGIGDEATEDAVPARRTRLPKPKPSQ